MIVRIFLLAFYVSLARSQDDIDILIDTVLGPPETNKSATKPREAVDENGDQCTCVPYYQCANGKIVTDGTGILDIRIRGVCQDYIDQCCKEPIDNAIKPKPIERRGCGQRHPDGVGFRIIGDKDNEAQFGEFPWMVALLRQNRLDDGTELMVYQCGGALIHENVVLTAAHCVAGKNEDSDLYARAGEWDTQRTNEIFPYQNRKVIRTVIHPGFQAGNLWNDFALLVVDKPFDFAENVDTICLPESGNVPLSRECYASGWGKNEYGQNGTYQVILKKIDLPIVPKDHCVELLRNTRLGKYFRLHESFVCAGGIVGKDTCKGDGGSPLACPIEGKPGTYEITGIVAWGIRCGDETPGVYAGVAYARPWIDKTMADIGFPLQ